jgi:hypothetical protein
VWSLKKSWKAERLSRGFILSIVMVVVVAVACHIAFFYDWRTIERNPTNPGTKEDAWNFTERYLAGRCFLRSRSIPRAKYDEVGKAWEFNGDCSHGGDAWFYCRVYFGADSKWHAESLYFWWPPEN